jgi:hypothetical protein
VAAAVDALGGGSPGWLWLDTWVGVTLTPGEAMAPAGTGSTKWEPLLAAWRPWFR